MEQAFNYFNAGKYKQAFSQLSSNTLNIESYEPNLAICEYLLSRTNNPLQMCLRKLANLLAKKNRKENDHYQRLTQQLIKYNIGILMHLSGKKENAYLLFEDIYRNEKCFMEFLKYRLLLLLMEINLSLKNGAEALKLSLKYLYHSLEQKNVSNSWISLLFHEHFRSHMILKEELDFMFGIFVSQSLMQLHLSELELPPDEDRINLKEVLLEKAKKRKNPINKYYEINLHMIDRFFQAQKEFHLGNQKKALELINFNIIQSEYDQMPQTKIVTNIYSGLTFNNTAIIYISLEKPHLALHFFDKAIKLVSKGCTGVEDKDLQLFSVNFSNQIHKISYNSGLLALINRPAEAHAILEFFKRNNYLSSDFKYWYRIGQSELESYHENYAKMAKEHRVVLLEAALDSFTNSLHTLSKKKEAPDFQTTKMYHILKQQEIDFISMKMKGEMQSFRESILLLICYISLLLEKYYKVIFYANQLLQGDKTKDTVKIYLYQYLISSYTKLGRIAEADKCQLKSQNLIKEHKRLVIDTGYFLNNQIIREKMESGNMELHQKTVANMKRAKIQLVRDSLSSQRFQHLRKSATSAAILYKQARKYLST